MHGALKRQEGQYAVHMELAAILNNKIFSVFYEKGLKIAHSIGLNEQEMMALMEFMKTKVGGPFLMRLESEEG